MDVFSSPNSLSRLCQAHIGGMLLCHTMDIGVCVMDIGVCDGDSGGIFEVGPEFLFCCAKLLLCGADCGIIPLCAPG
jgi:hypothetical protein